MRMITYPTIAQRAKWRFPYDAMFSEHGGYIHTVPLNYEHPKICNKIDFRLVRWCWTFRMLQRTTGRRHPSINLPYAKTPIWIHESNFSLVSKRTMTPKDTKNVRFWAWAPIDRGGGTCCQAFSDHKQKQPFEPTQPTKADFHWFQNWQWHQKTPKTSLFEI